MTAVATKWEGAKLLQTTIVFFVGLILWFSPRPDSISVQGWHLLAIFVATVVGLVLRPLPMGAVALLSIPILVVTRTLPLEVTLGGFAHDQIWLIVIACFIARGFIKTGLGRRIAYLFLTVCGRNPLGIAYGFIASDLVMAPAIPSSTARAGGVIMPIIKSLCETLGSKGDDPSAAKIGTFLTLVSFQGTVITTAMFLTSAAQNPIIAKMASLQGIEMTWTLWALAMIVPGLLSLFLIPIIIYRLSPPELKETAHASAHAKEKLNEMGKVSNHEKSMLVAFVMLITLWVFGKNMALHPTVAAMIGLGFLMLTGVLTWKDLLDESVAWDSLIWFSVLVMMAANLNSLGVIGALTNSIEGLVHGLRWPHALIILLLGYLYVQYFFASITARVTAMYAPFLGVALAVGTPPLLAAFSLAAFSSICGGITHYSNGPAPILYSLHYVEMKTWWRVGFIMSALYALIWIGVGGLWWKLLGFW